MVEVEITFHVNRPINDVFDLISDMANYWKWAPSESKFFIGNKITSESSSGLGTTYVDRLKWWGKSIGEIVEYQPPSRIEFEQETSFVLPAFSASIGYTLRPVQNFTEVFHRFRAMPYGLFKLLKPILSIVVRLERDRTCKAIKEALEYNQNG